MKPLDQEREEGSHNIEQLARIFAELTPSEKKAFLSLITQKKEPATIEEQQTKNKQQFVVSKIRLLYGFFIGSITGSFFWLYQEIFKEESQHIDRMGWDIIHVGAYALIALAGITVFLLMNTKRTSPYQYAVVVPFALVMVEVILTGILHRGESFFMMMAWVIAITTVLGVGYIAAMRDTVHRSDLPHLLHLYIKKLVEIIFISGLLMIAVGIVTGIFSGLLEIVDIDFPEYIEEHILPLLMYIIGAAIPVMVWAVVYDFSLPLSQQSEKYFIIPFFRVAYGISIVVGGIFLALYILFLVPSGFDALLETGDTVPLFLFTALAVMGAHFFTIDWFKKGSLKGWFSKIEKFAFVLNIEIVVLLIIACYAIYVRINEYGITFPRVWVVILLIIAAVVTIRYLFIWTKAILGKNTPEETAQRLQSTHLWPFIAGAIAVLGCIFINVETISLQQHLEKVGKTELLNERIDRWFVEEINPKQAIPLLVERYEDADTVERLDIIYTLDYFKREYFKIDSDYTLKFSEYPSPHLVQVNTALEELYTLETDEKIKTIIKNIQTTTRADSYSCTSLELTDTTNCYKRCIEPVGDILDIPYYPAQNRALTSFCSNY